MAENELNDLEWQNPANWFAGWFYHSRVDTRTWVLKRVPALGDTINFARPAGLAIAIAIPTLITALIVTAALGH